MSLVADVENLKESVSALQNKINALTTAIAAKVSASDIASALSTMDSMVSALSAKVTALETYNNSLNAILTRIRQDTTFYAVVSSYTNPAAESSIVTLNAGVTNTTGYTAPDFPRKLRLSFVNWKSGANVKITGTDQLGNSIIEYISTGEYTNYSFRTITEIDTTASDTGTVTLYWSNYIALSAYPIAKVIQVKINGTVVSPGYSLLDTTYGAILFSTIPNGSNSYEVTFSIA